MGFLGRLLLGKGTLKPELRAQLEAERLVLVEEGLSGSVRYTHFRAPGRRFHGKITPERMALALSERRVVLYCRSGRAKLIDSEYSNPRVDMLDLELEDDKLIFRIDYDRAGEPRVSGQVAIHVNTPNAGSIAAQLRARLRR